MIIDIHVHVKPTLDPGALYAESTRHGVSMVCNLGGGTGRKTSVRSAAVPGPVQQRKENDRTMELVRERPDFFIGFCRLNPNNKKDFLLKEITRCIEKGNLKGVKLTVHTNARKRLVDPIMRACARLDVPVLYHAWYKTVGKVLNESSPADIADLAARHPGTKIIMAHLTAAGMRGILDIQPYPNIHVDTSGSQPFSGIIEYGVEKLGAERILFGTDIPIRDFSCQLGRIYGAGISRRDRALILGLNAKRLLKL